MVSTKTKKKKFDGSEKRGADRRPILDTFSFFLSIPKKGDYRLPLHDISELGVGFDLNTIGEELSDFPVKEGEELEANFYLNQSLYLPLRVRIRRVVPASKKEGIFKAGAEIVDRESQGYRALMSFLRMLDEITGAARIAQ